MAKSSIAVGTMLFVKKRSVTRPVMQIDGSKPVYFKVEGPIHIAPQVEGIKPKVASDGTIMPNPHIVHVVNLETGEESTIVANSVLKSELSSNYPDEGYVGKSFCVSKTGTKKSASGTSYSTFQISEIELAEETPGEPVKATPPAMSKPAVTPTKGK